VTDPDSTHRFPAAYDLHLHTHWSFDATLEPGAHFRRATELGLRCIAITEHHHLDSAPEVARLAALYPQLRVLHAAEFSVTTSLGGIDLLCYGLPPGPGGPLAGVVERYRRWQREIGEAMSRGMQSYGFAYDEAGRLDVLRSYRAREVLKHQGLGSQILRKREVDHFVACGWFSTPEEASELQLRILKEFPRPPFPAVEEVVPAVKAAGGLVVIAHPARYFQGDNLRRMETLREECALDGLECAHHAVHPELTRFYRNYCRRHGLLSTAGSDSHHAEHLAPPTGPWHEVPERKFACHLGEEAWLDELLERLS